MLTPTQLQPPSQGPPPPPPPVPPPVAPTPAALQASLEGLQLQALQAQYQALAEQVAGLGAQRRVLMNQCWLAAGNGHEMSARSAGSSRSASAVEMRTSPGSKRSSPAMGCAAERLERQAERAARSAKAQADFPFNNGPRVSSRRSQRRSASPRYRVDVHFRRCTDADLHRYLRGRLLRRGPHDHERPQ